MKPLIDFFQVIETLLHKGKYISLPSHDSAGELAEVFADHFVGKIEKIRRYSVQTKENNAGTDEDVKRYTKVTDFLMPATEEENKAIFLKLPPKSRELDTIPTWLLKVCISELLPLITNIINLS